MTRHISSRTRWAIKGYVNQGYSANRIQRNLSRQDLGIRRKTLLVEIRRAKHERIKPHAEKYTPIKYQHRLGIRKARGFGAKQVTLLGTHLGRWVKKQKYGSGSQLYDFVLEEMQSDFWDEKPEVTS